MRRERFTSRLRGKTNVTDNEHSRAGRVGASRVVGQYKSNFFCARGFAVVSPRSIFFPRDDFSEDMRHTVSSLILVSGQPE